jgi:hypothetical protein
MKRDPRLHFLSWDYHAASMKIRLGEYPLKRGMFFALR